MSKEMRRSLVEQVLADPPQVHALDGESASDRLGIWRTADSCYQLLRAEVGPGSRTLETGLGLSTALFAALGAEHVCVVSRPQEAERLAAYCELKGLPTENLRFEIGFSDEILPSLALGPLDLVLIDGGHGFPVPVIDWHYGARTLRVGGMLVLDDVTLPAVYDLRRILDRDPRWSREHLTDKWAAYRKTGAAEAVEDWWEQQEWMPFPLPVRLKGLARRVGGVLRGR